MDQKHDQYEASAKATEQLLATEAAEMSLKQPRGSDIAVEETADGITLTVPPAGIWEGSQGFLHFGLCWMGVTAIVTGVLVFCDGGPTGQELILAILFVGLLWIVGFGLLIGAISLAGRRAELIVSGDQLLAFQTGFVRDKRQKWMKQEILEIRSGLIDTDPTNFGEALAKMLNLVPMELQIIPVKGDKFSMLSGRDAEELRWVAAKLRQLLRIEGKGKDAVR
ncbi:MAG: hypothetical protein JNM56_27750 [Planctomycetia bacterium]|nr:hypothetical protein [Planctomycetia bacterium]